MTFAVLYDANRCTACRGCQAACKQWNMNDEVIPGVENVGKPSNTGSYENPPQLSARTFTKIRFTEIENNGELRWMFTKIQCMHCEHPACAAACPVAALQKTPEGPVIYDESRCIGCRYCMVACPFGVPTFEWRDSTPWVRKCDFCHERLAEGLEPACVNACPNGALKFGERDDLILEARERIASEPGKYVDYIYGENEAGGTSWLYISKVPVEKLGFPAVDSSPVTVNTARAMGFVPPVLLGVAATMTGIYWLTKRKKELVQAEDTDKN
jgi:formate dehydrogenase iron-sulfur subunit